MNKHDQLQKAYDHCINIVHGHYENFPVASLVLPKRLRRPIATIYAFARSADDLADEGQLAELTRLEKLDAYTKALDTITQGRITQNQRTEDPIFTALSDVIEQYHLPIQLFHDLLTAFKQDVTKKRYATFAEVLAYCRYSANPIGRLLLHLLDAATEENIKRSDAICSSLQLINFLQDVGQDYDENDRIYLAQDEMRHFHVGELHIKNHINDDALRRFMKHQVNRAREMILSGQLLGNTIPGRFGLQLRLMISGGLQILDALDKHQKNAFYRPRLTTRDWLSMMTYALLKYRYIIR